MGGPGGAEARIRQGMFRCASNLSQYGGDVSDGLARQPYIHFGRDEAGELVLCYRLAKAILCQRKGRATQVSFVSGP